MFITASELGAFRVSNCGHPPRGRATMRKLIFWITLAAVCALPVGSHAQQQRDPVIVGPQQVKCSDILELQKLNIDSERNVIKLDYLHPQRGADYMAVVGWLQGFFSARNLFDVSIDGDFTQGSKSIEWMDWMFGFCRDHPTKTLFDAGIGLSNKLAKAYRESRRSERRADGGDNERPIPLR